MLDSINTNLRIISILKVHMALGKELRLYSAGVKSTGLGVQLPGVEFRLSYLRVAALVVPITDSCFQDSMR